MVTKTKSGSSLAITRNAAVAVHEHGDTPSQDRGATDEYRNTRAIVRRTQDLVAWTDGCSEQRLERQHCHAAEERQRSGHRDDRAADPQPSATGHDLDNDVVTSAPQRETPRSRQSVASEHVRELRVELDLTRSRAYAPVILATADAKIVDDSIGDDSE